MRFKVPGGRAAAALAITVAASCTYAQQPKFPSKPIRMVVPFSPAS
jgi:tripartite-type tricarboxylate transporter receptor subunit TctC